MPVNRVELSGIATTVHVNQFTMEALTRYFDAGDNCAQTFVEEHNIGSAASSV